MTVMKPSAVSCISDLIEARARATTPFASFATGMAI
jgi:hypothetical protein